MNFLIMNFVNRMRDGPLPNYPKLGPQEAENHTGVQSGSVSHHVNQLRKDIYFNPKDKHFDTNGALNDKLELELVMETEETYIRSGHYFNNLVLRHWAVAMRNQARLCDQLLPILKATNEMCRNFRRHHYFIWRKAGHEEDHTRYSGFTKKWNDNNWMIKITFAFSYMTLLNLIVFISSDFLFNCWSFRYPWFFKNYSTKIRIVWE